MIAVYVLLFNFSLPKFEKRFQIEEASNYSFIKAKEFFANINEKDKQTLLILPCSEGKSCEGAKDLGNRVNSFFADGIIKRGLLLNQNGVEVFSGRAMDPKYSKLINQAKLSGQSYLKETISTPVENSSRIVTVLKLSEPSGQNILDNRFLLTLVEASSLNLKKHKAIFGVVTFLPVFIAVLYFLLRNPNRSKADAGPKVSVSKKSSGQEQNYIEEIEELKKINAGQSQFLANFTHELRTPLNSIIGFSGLLKDQTLGNLGNPEYLKYATDINNSGVHLLSLINDILDYSKSETGKLKVNLTEVDVVKVLKQALSIIAPRASESRVDLMQSFSNDYFIIRLDPKRFKQIILNLLSNSVKFTPEGGSVTVSVFPDIKGDKVSIEVKDTGVGIAEKDIPTVMSLFGQVETDLNRKYEGTGIGLPFAKKLTSLMGGIFDLQSKVGEGTSITLTFPYDKKLNAEYAELYKKQS